MATKTCKAAPKATIAKKSDKIVSSKKTVKAPARKKVAAR